jgi:hypothetical protein
MNLQPIVDALPGSIGVELAEAMAGKGAVPERAAEAVAIIQRAVADWLFSGGHRTREATPDAKVKAELERVAKAAATLQDSLSKMSVAANVRLMVSLQDESKGPCSGLASPHWNADPVEIDTPSRGLLSAARRLAGEPRGKIVLPANLAAKVSRFQTDLNALVEPMRRAAHFEAKKSANEPLKHLFRQVIWAWTEAVDEWPSEGIVAGHDDDPGGRAALGRKRRGKELTQEVARAASPIPGALRAMAAAILGDAPATLNDSAFLRALKTEKQRARPAKSGLLSLARAKHIPKPRRGRPKKLNHKSPATD